jgi:hypothetical protein
MVSFLVENGADANMFVRSDASKPFTVWRAALAIFPSIYGSDFLKPGDEEWRKWLQVYKIFLEHGGGHFPGTARLRARKSIDQMLNRARFTIGNWETLIHQLREGKQLPNVYSEAGRSKDGPMSRTLWIQPKLHETLRIETAVEESRSSHPYGRDFPSSVGKRSISPDEETGDVTRRRM